MATDRPRYTVSVEPELFEQIEDFRYQNRFQTRSKATEALIKLGLKALAEQQEKTDKQSPEEEAK